MLGDQKSGRNIISIHAPARGATFRALINQSTTIYFNPRSRTGSDPRSQPLYDNTEISIHAPARGATSPSRFCLLRQSFQSTLPHGERRRPLGL